MRGMRTISWLKRYKGENEVIGSIVVDMEKFEDFKQKLIYGTSTVKKHILACRRCM